MKISKISKSFGDKKVLDNISFELEKGQITSIVGRNGSGKTTLLKTINRILDPDRGDILIDGKSLIKEEALQREIVYLPDRFDFFLYSNAEKTMNFYKIIYPNFDEKFVIEEAEKLKLSLKKSFKSQSKGNKAILGLLIVLATNAQYLFLDEILDGMDILNKEIIIKYLLDATESGKSILISSHQLNELQGISDKVIYLNLSGNIEKFEDTNESVHKIQIVTKEILPKDISNMSIIRSHLGRVYIVLFDGSLEEIEEKLNCEDIVQYDILPIQMEDLFYLEKGKEQVDERL
ncbi:MAG: ATP-binding cassette domain-containing protein [Peptoniphilaceae bacterium]